VPVDRGLRETRARATDAHSIVLVETALAARRRLRIHTGNAHQDVSDVFVGQLANVLGGHDLNNVG
jgi:hypothetical protein